MKRLQLLMGIGLLLLGAGNFAHAAVITSLYNTGVDAAGTPRSNGTLGDLHYNLVSAPGGTTVTRILTSAGGYPAAPAGPWLGDNLTSAWIGPNNDPQLDGPVGTYIYRTTFSLVGLDPTTALITGRWSTDNAGLGIYINGNLVPGSTTSDTSFTSWTAFSITSGFVSGLNTIEFRVNNDGGPTGLRVEMNGTAAETPEPASLAIWGGIGLAGLVAGWRSRRLRAE